jgi:integrase
MVNGKRMFKALKDKEGHPITKLKAAESARDELMAIFRATGEKEALENIAAKLQTATAEVARLEDEATPALSMLAAWEAYRTAPSRPDSGPRTLAGYESQWNRFADWMKDAHPDKPALRDVSREIAGVYAADLAKNFGGATYNKHIALLSLVFRTLAENPDARLTADPFAKVSRKRAVANSRRELTLEELARVCAAITGEMRALFAIGLYTGLRLGDAATLRWQETDLARGIIMRIPNKTARRNPKPVTVPLHPSLAAMLATTPEKKRRGYVLPETADLYQRDAAALSKRIQDLFEHNGIKTEAEGTGFVRAKNEDGQEKWEHTGKRAVVEVGFHSLRHSFVSLCRASGAPLAVVESLVGHSSPAMTRHYTHTGEAAARVSVEALPYILGDAKELPALSAPADVTAATGHREPLPGWALEAIGRALLALDNGDTETVRTELAVLL